MLIRYWLDSFKPSTGRPFYNQHDLDMRRMRRRFDSPRGFPCRFRAFLQQRHDQARRIAARRCHWTAARQRPV